MNQNNFIMDTLSIITVNNQNNAYKLKNIINSKSDDTKLKKISYNKFINPFPIYSLISENTKITNEFLNKEKYEEMKIIKQKLWRFILYENGWNLIENEKIDMEHLTIDILYDIDHDILCSALFQRTTENKQYP